MDRLIKRWEAKEDADLMVCAARGVAYQRDMSKGRIKYDAAYLATFDRYAAGPIADKLLAGRVAMLTRHTPAGGSVLDVGAASGAFMRAARAASFGARGFDVIPEAVTRLKEAGKYADNPADFDTVTLWDSIEHMEGPGAYLERVRKGATLLAAIPVVDTLDAVRASKHFKPGEHLYYWTAQGFIDWAALYGFRLLEQSAHEVEAGRENIGAFAFRRDLKDYADFIKAYEEMHFSRYYGASATELHLAMVAKIVCARRPASILDYGCGRSDLVAHFWRDGERRIERYDPAIRPYRTLPDGKFDLALCCDVMEHIPMAGVDTVLGELSTKSPVALFTISTKLARAKLPDGTNAHVTLLTFNEWTRWIKSYFCTVQRLPETTEHQLYLLAGA